MLGRFGLGSHGVLRRYSVGKFERAHRHICANSQRHSALCTTVQQRIHQAAIDILGPDALVNGPWTHDYLESYSETIAGGTAEIQRNIIAERILGLPREATG